MNGATLHMLRELQGPTQRQSALRAYLSPSTRSLLENEPTRADTPTLTRPLRGLKYTPKMDVNFEALLRLVNGGHHDARGDNHD